MRWSSPIATTAANAPTTARRTNAGSRRSAAPTTARTTDTIAYIRSPDVVERWNVRMSIRSWDTATRTPRTPSTPIQITIEIDTIAVMDEPTPAITPSTTTAPVEGVGTRLGRPPATKPAATTGSHNTRSPSVSQPVTTWRSLNEPTMPTAQT